MSTDTREALAALHQWMPLEEAMRLASIWTDGVDLDNAPQWKAAIKVLAEEVAALATHPAQPSAELLNLRAEAEALRKALLAIVDRDLTFFDGCVDRNTITYGEIQQARAAIAATKEQQ